MFQEHSHCFLSLTLCSSERLSRKYQEILAKDASSYNQSAQHDDQQQIAEIRDDDFDHRALFGQFGGGISEHEHTKSGNAEYCD